MSAAKEFGWTRNLAAQQGAQIPKVIVRHLIQSFDVDEVSLEEAQEVEKPLADEWLKGKYEYVIATHIDKGHCHNHIIFNAVNYVDFHAYRSKFKKETKQIYTIKANVDSYLSPVESKDRENKRNSELE